MKLFRIFVISLTLSLLTGLGVSSFADDTEIYSRKVEALDEQTRPNILFMLDNSGSMNSPIRNDDGTPTGQRRIDVLKDALLQMLDKTNNVNVGLGRFASLIKKNDKDYDKVNAPILFPVTFIDAPISKMPGEIDDTIMGVSVSIAQGADDAEQNVGTEELFLKNKELHMVQAVVEEKGIEIAVNADDATEWLGEFGKNLTVPGGNVLYLGADGNENTKQNKGPSLIGLRFQNIGIPKGATINKAVVKFRCPTEEYIETMIGLDKPKEVCDKALTVTIKGAANDGISKADPSGNPFVRETGYLSGTGYSEGEEKFPPILEDDGTELTYTWQIGATQNGRTFETVDIQEIIKKTIALPAWKPSNSIVLLFEPVGISPARAFYAKESGQGAAELVVHWSWGDNNMVVPIEKRSPTAFYSATEYTAKQNSSGKISGGDIKLGNTSTGDIIGTRFKLPIPKGTTITEACIFFTHQQKFKPTAPNTNAAVKEKNSAKGYLELDVYGENTPDAKPFSDANISERTGELIQEQWELNEAPDSLTDVNLITGIPDEDDKLKVQAIRENLQVDFEALSEKETLECDISSDSRLQFATPSLKEFLTKVINQQEWESGNHVAFWFERNPNSSVENSFRRIVSNNGKDTVKCFDEVCEHATAVIPFKAEQNEATDLMTVPHLRVTFSAQVPEQKANPENDKQVVGLRFESIDIPQGAKVVSANLVFQSGFDTSGPATYTIRAEKVVEALPFSSEHDILKRLDNSTSGVSWTVGEPWYEGITYQTNDLTSIIQELVNQPTWCGGNVAFLISNDSPSGPFPLRNAKSYDDKPGFAPVLNVDFDSKKINGNGCVKQTWSGQISARTDDAEEKLPGALDSGLVTLTSSTLESPTAKSGATIEPRLIGLRFSDIPIRRGATIEKAYLLLTAKSDKSGSAKFKISGEKTDSAGSFSNNDRHLSKRWATKTSEVIWSLSDDEEDAWEANQVYRSVDISSVISEIINQEDWETYNSMALFISPGSGQRNISSFDAGPMFAPILRIQVDGYLGESGEGDIMTVRRRLKNTVKKMEIPASMTPIVDALYESTIYFQGRYIDDYGRTRHGEREYRVSHPATYEGGSSHKPPEGCSINSKPFAEECASEEVTGTPSYISPIKSNCQSNHIVLLTDGLATRHTSLDMVKGLINNSDCLESYKDIDNPGETIKVSKNEECGIDLADFLIATDHVNRREGDKNNIVLHTIGFQLGKGWRSIYQGPSGRDIYKEDGVYKYIPKDKTKEGENASDTDLEKLSSTGRYEENPKGTKSNEEAVKFLKRLASLNKTGERNFHRADTVNDLSKAFDDILGSILEGSSSFAAPGISVNQFNTLFHSEYVYFSLFEPSAGQLVWNGNLKKYRYTGEEIVDQNDESIATVDNLIKEGTSSFWSENDGRNVTQGGAGAQTKAQAEGRNIFTYLWNAPPGENHRIDLSQFKIDEDDQKEGLTKLLFSSGDDSGNRKVNDDEYYALIDWITGKGATTRTWPFADPLHSSPKVVTYGVGQESQSDDSDAAESERSKIFIGTNDGLIRMIDAATGQEDWAFLPKEMLLRQEEMMKNEAAGGEERIYGIDGTIKLWGSNRDNLINHKQGDFVRLYTGMRRGGKNIYALDVTGHEGTAGNPPKLMWVIRGGDSGDFGFEKLGQTWSSPKVTEVDSSYCYGTATTSRMCVVLLFGGGYAGDGEGDSQTDTNIGNAIYMVNAKTGDLLWWASDGEDSGDDFLSLGEQMTYPIPSDITLVDSVGDSRTDRIYVGDLGGQIWRVDLLGKGETKGGRIAELGTTVSEVDGDNRSFFYQPAVVNIKGKDLLTIVSGKRPYPLGTNIDDRFYAFIDKGWEEEHLTTLNLSNLEDVTDDIEGTKVNLVDKEDTMGWYLDLEGNGEKGSGPPIIISEEGHDETVYFTTYMPPGTQNSACEFDPGDSFLYSLNLRTGGAKKDSDSDDKDDSDDSETGDRKRGDPAGKGMIAAPVEISTAQGSSLLVGIRTPVQLKKNLIRFFWSQQE
ncbi:PilC/PilY family type IV pilus protein [Candidatus Parabeggiatoa sp. HSG14]|uniref:PilC/PilY family type IV pilus protein n=1 Tax=Candidatus Parabeggiatoa sp. HSG14 TaxID=3055593 RepID=UPI0025A6F01C|nr:PilC/PilY family type IV pilus protein [Thiotrichales bacterium HSG14]